MMKKGLRKHRRYASLDGKWKPDHDGSSLNLLGGGGDEAPLTSHDHPDLDSSSSSGALSPATKTSSRKASRKESRKEKKALVASSMMPASLLGERADSPSVSGSDAEGSPSRQMSRNGSGASSSGTQSAAAAAVASSAAAIASLSAAASKSGKSGSGSGSSTAGSATAAAGTAAASSPRSKTLWRSVKKNVLKGISSKDAPVVMSTRAASVQQFGLPLVEAVRRSRMSDQVDLPLVVRKCIDYIEEHGLDMEGVYRVSGQKSKIDALKKLFDQGGEPDLMKMHGLCSSEDISVVSSVLKLFFRELPELLVPNEVGVELKTAMGQPDEEGRVSAIQEALGKLPPCNYLLLATLIKHLCNVAALSEENKMTKRNLVLVFSPTLRISNELLVLMLERADDLFADITIKPLTSDVYLVGESNVKDGLEEEEEEDAAIVPEQAEERIQAEIRLLEQAIDRQHQIVQEQSADGGQPDSAVMDELWNLQRTLTNLRRELKQCAGAGAEHEHEPPARRASISSINSVASMAAQELSASSDQTALCSVLEALYRELVAQNAELQASQKLLTQQLEQEREHRERIKGALSMFSAARAANILWGEPSSSSQEVLEARLATLRQRHAALVDNRNALAEHIAEERMLCIEAGAKVQCFLANEQPGFSLGRRWSYRTG